MSEVREPSPRSTGPRRLIVWVDSHVSPSIAAWLGERFPVESRSTTRLGLASASDHAVFHAARSAGAAAIVTKDEDFEQIVRQFGTPPAIVVLACGNAGNAELREILDAEFERAMSHVRRGEPIVEIGRAP